MNRMNTRIMSNLEEYICQMSKMSIHFDVKQIAYVKLITMYLDISTNLL